MNRRDAVLALAVFGDLPPAALAQPTGKVWRVGFLAARKIADVDKDPHIGGTLFTGHASGGTGGERSLASGCHSPR